ncbi:hypothetical protein C2E23DRAFT_831058 [Lenzites betulinus]|nr:hypothetical protein C2E23DRAFT_831058 [Lenzites betulinus]
MTCSRAVPGLPKYEDGGNSLPRRTSVPARPSADRQCEMPMTVRAEHPRSKKAGIDSSGKVERDRDADHSKILITQTRGWSWGRDGPQRR